MRYASLVLIVFLMGWTWSVIKTPLVLSEETHLGIQEDLKRVIKEYLEGHLTSVEELKFEKFWTQAIKDDQVKATFSYSFEEGGASALHQARIGVEGHAILNRQKATDSQYDVWSLDELYVSNNRVTFKEGPTIRPTGSPADDEQ